MLGALTLPTLWTMSQDALNVLIHKPLLRSEEITLLFALGFLPGMILGAGTVRAWVKWRASEIGETRWLLIGHGAFVAIPCFFIAFADLSEYFSDIAQGDWSFAWREAALHFYFNFPLQCAVFLLLLGLFMRGNRA